MVEQEREGRNVVMYLGVQIWICFGCVRMMDHLCKWVGGVPAIYYIWTVWLNVYLLLPNYVTILPIFKIDFQNWSWYTLATVLIYSFLAWHVALRPSVVDLVSRSWSFAATWATGTLYSYFTASVHQFRAPWVPSLVFRIRQTWGGRPANDTTHPRSPVILPYMTR